MMDRLLHVGDLVIFSENKESHPAWVREMLLNQANLTAKLNNL